MEITGSAPHAALKRTAIESAGATSKVQQILHSLQVLQVGRVGETAPNRGIPEGIQSNSRRTGNAIPGAVVHQVHGAAVFPSP
jgi:hypothetical protein